MKCACAAPAVAVVVGLCVPCAVNGQDPIPQDPALTCTLTPAQFAQWFTSGTVQKDGPVSPADSLNFAPTSLCDFYKWSWQMFLWVTSPQPSQGGSSVVFNSPVFFDVSPPGSGQRTFIPNAAGVKRLALFSAQVNRKGQAVRLSPTGNLLHPEGGQATGDVLMTQQGSLVYYGIHNNDVFAYFLTGNKTGGIMPPLTNFTAAQADLKQVTDFAGKQGKRLTDANALIMELKSSWVDASTLSNPGAYLTLVAQVPTYTQSSSIWTPTGKTQQLKLALVGMHVVGTVKNHPEMVWATFEHLDSAPNGNYAYTNVNNDIVTVPQSTGGSWLFCKTGSTGPFNASHMTLDPKTGSIVAKKNLSVSPSDTLRNNPWGQGTTSNNTQIICLNNNIRSMIPPNDVRRNYCLIGALWSNGKIPGFDPAGQVQQVGSTQLANASMESYFQFPTLNCFSCHGGSPANALGALGGQGLSHVYGDLQPLFK